MASSRATVLLVLALVAALCAGASAERQLLKDTKVEGDKGVKPGGHSHSGGGKFSCKNSFPGCSSCKKSGAIHTCSRCKASGTSWSVELNKCACSRDGYGTLSKSLYDSWKSGKKSVSKKGPQGLRQVCKLQLRRPGWHVHHQCFTSLIKGPHTSLSPRPPLERARAPLFFLFCSHSLSLSLSAASERVQSRVSPPPTPALFGALPVESATRAWPCILTRRRNSGVCVAPPFFRRAGPTTPPPVLSILCL